MAESKYWNRFWRRRISRRTLLGAGAVTVVGVAGAAVVGCNGDDGGSGGTQTTPRSGSPVPVGSPQPGGSITQGRLFEAGGIDPHIDLTGFGIYDLMYTYLYSWRASVEEPILNNFVTEMELPDATHFNFTLRRGVKVWPAPYGGPAADEELTSTDCKESFLRRGTALTAPDKRYPQRFLPEKGGRLDTPDPYTFNITLTRPFIPALQDMANGTWAIIPAKVIEAYPAGLSQVAFGSGPFMMDEFRGSERIVLKRHPNFFLNPRPWLDEIRIIVIAEGSSLLAAFRSGQHDVNGAVLSKADAEQLMESDDFIVDKFPSLFYPVIHMKMRPPFNDIRVREAIDLALDRDDFINVIWSGEGQYNGPIQWPQVKWALPQEELRAFYRHDPERAKQLLTEAGFPDGFKTKMKLPKLPGAAIIGDMAVLIKDQLSRVGIDVQLDEVELGAYIANVILPGNFDMTFFPNLPYQEPDRPLSFYHSLGVTGAGNWTNYTNPALDKLIDGQAEEFDVEKRQAIILEAQRLILPEHGPQLTLPGSFGYAARWKHVHLPTEFAALGPELPTDAGPIGADIWVDTA
ncbi:MAG: ABC transporter substrate-binding protein [Chloroflexi bacterium]|nr:ABC transporter substrate-binding protein [Chloroflexota bacterium]